MPKTQLPKRPVRYVTVRGILTGALLFTAAIMGVGAEAPDNRSRELPRDPFKEPAEGPARVERSAVRVDVGQLKMTLMTTLEAIRNLDNAAHDTRTLQEAKKSVLRQLETQGHDLRKIVLSTIRRGTMQEVENILRYGGLGAEHMNELYAAAFEVAEREPGRLSRIMPFFMRARMFGVKADSLVSYDQDRVLTSTAQVNPLNIARLTDPRFDGLLRTFIEEGLIEGNTVREYELYYHAVHRQNFRLANWLVTRGFAPDFVGTQFLSLREVFLANPTDPAQRLAQQNLLSFITQEVINAHGNNVVMTNLMHLMRVTPMDTPFNIESLATMIQAQREWSDINIDLQIGGKTLLMAAVERNDLALVNQLLAFGANVNAVNARGKSVLQIAVDQCRRIGYAKAWPIIEALSDSRHEPNLTLQDSQGKSLEDQIEEIKSQVEKGATPWLFSTERYRFEWISLGITMLITAIGKYFWPRQPMVNQKRVNEQRARGRNRIRPPRHAPAPETRAPAPAPAVEAKAMEAEAKAVEARRQIVAEIVRQQQEQALTIEVLVLWRRCKNLVPESRVAGTRILSELVELSEKTTLEAAKSFVSSKERLEHFKAYADIASQLIADWRAQQPQQAVQRNAIGGETIESLWRRATGVEERTELHL